MPENAPRGRIAGGRGGELRALAITGAETGSDAGHLRTAADRDGGEEVVNGDKNSVSTLNADNFLVFACTGRWRKAPGL